MGIVQDYLRAKKIKELGLPTIYVVKSDRSGVELPKARQVVEIRENHSITTYSDGNKIANDKYFMENEFPYEIKIDQGKISETEKGYASGVGDLWHWSYYCTLSKEDADEYYQKELKRVNEKYILKKL